jgi:hypothetical protein
MKSPCIVSSALPKNEPSAPLILSVSVCTAHSRYDRTSWTAASRSASSSCDNITFWEGFSPRQNSFRKASSDASGNDPLFARSVWPCAAIRSPRTPRRAITTISSINCRYVGSARVSSIRSSNSECGRALDPGTPIVIPRFGQCPELGRLPPDRFPSHFQSGR